MNEQFFFACKSSGKLIVAGEQQATLGRNPATARTDGDVFAEWIWDDEKLTLTNDRYGFYPIYYFADDEKIGVSTSIVKLLDLGAEKDLDDDAMSVFLRLGWLIGEDTLFKSIRAVPPGTTLTWQNGNLQIISKEIIIAEKKEISRSQAIENYGEIFQKVIEETLPANNKFAVPLSGGRDSRHIVFALEKAKIKPDACLTIIHPPPRSNEDSRIAAQICETLSIKHLLIEQGNSRLEAERRKNLLTGFSVFEHGWFLTLADFIEEKWQTIYDGIAGDVLSAGLFLDAKRLELYEAGKFAELADLIMEKEAYLPTMLTAENYRRFSREKAVRRLVKELEKHANAPNPIGSFFFWNRTRRCIAVSPLRLIDNKTEIKMPYLAAEAFDFLSALPARMFLDFKFHTETISRFYPEFAHLSYEDKNNEPIFDAKHFKNYSREILRSAMSKRNIKLINQSFVFSRGMRCLLDKKYSKAIVEFAEPLILLMQIERLKQQKISA